MPKKLTQEIFINRTNQRHNNKYDYSKVTYTTSRNFVTIICPIHGEFFQTADSHLAGHGCEECSGSKKLTTEKFIAKCRKIHGDLYNYDKVNYVNATKKVTIICRIHGDFEQIASLHSKGGNCPSCTGHSHRTTAHFIENALKIHNNTYIYDKVDYVNVKMKVTIICRIHGDFLQTPNDHLSGNGCPDCGGKKQLTQEEFIIRARAVHNEKYDYSKTEYLNINTKVIIICPIHDQFEQTPHGHLQGHGCFKCYPCTLKTNEEFVSDAQRVHGKDTYDYSETVYTGMANKVKIRCKLHGVFEQCAHNHVNGGQGCPNCNHLGYSKSAIEWLKYMEKKDKTFIQHAENDKEFVIPTTTYRADGYSKELNKIYEFLGDFWHGNPNVYDAEYINVFNKKSMKELYDTTFVKLNKIHELGYECEFIWEADWNKLKCAHTGSIM